MAWKYGPLNNSLNAFGPTRLFDRGLWAARTIADLEGSADVLDHHIMEAIAYRNLDRLIMGRCQG